MKPTNQLRSAPKALLILSLATVFAVAGCSTTSSMSGSSDAAMADPQMDRAAIATTESFAQADMKEGGGPAVTAAIIKTGDAWIITSEPDAAATKFTELVESLGGRVESTWQSDDSPSRSANVGARVPADKYDELVAKLPDFGKIQNQSTNTQDVGQEIADLDARRAALETSIERLTTLMKGATTTEDLLQAEDMMTQRQAELDSLNSQLQWLNGQVDMSSLSVNFSTGADSADSGFSWDRAWHMLGQSFLFVAYFAVIVLPWVLIVGAIAALVVVAVRRRRKRRAAAASVAAPVVEETIEVVPEVVDPEL